MFCDRAGKQTVVEVDTQTTKTGADLLGDSSAETYYRHFYTVSHEEASPERPPVKLL